MDIEATSFFDAWVTAEDADRDAIRVKKIYIDINEGNLIDGVLFSQIVYWHGTSPKTGKSRLKASHEGQLWLARKYSEWYDECRINPQTARASIDRMVKRGLLIRKVFHFNGRTTTHIRIDPVAFKTATMNAINRIPEISHIANGNDAVSHSGNMRNRIRSTETTADTTSKTPIQDAQPANAVAPRTSDPLGDDIDSQPIDPKAQKLLDTVKASAATERLSTTIQEKAVTPESTAGNTPKEKSSAKKERVELSEALTFSSRFQEVGPGDYITHAIASNDTLERTVCGKPIEELLIIKELPYAHILHACEKCLAVVEGVRATGGGQLPTAPLVKAAKKPKTPKPESDLPPLTNEAKDALALECYGTVTAWNYAPNASAMGKALRDCKNPTAEQIKAHQRWWNVNDFRGRKGQRPRPHQVAETWAEALQELSNGNGRLLGNRAESRIRYDDYPE